MVLGLQSLLNSVGLWMPVVAIGLLFVILLLRYIVLPVLTQSFPRLRARLTQLTDLLWRLISQPSLNIEDFDKGGTDVDIGKTLAAMVEEECQNIDSKEDVQSVARKMTIVTAPTGKLELPDVKSLVPQLGFFSQLANILPSFLSLLGRKYFTFTLSGYLHSASDRGVGLTLTLKNEQGNIISNCTVWQKDYDPELSSKSDNSKNPAPYYFLVEPAAIWTLFQLDDQIKRLEIKKWSGLKNWKSYAYFRAGVYWRIKDRNDWAKLMFSDALNEDIDNRFAVLNLGILNTLNSEYDRAIERLNLAKNMSTKSAKSQQYICGILKDTVWYKSSYQLAANYLYKCNLAAAKQEADVLLKQIQQQINYHHNSINNSYKNCNEDRDVMNQINRYIDFLEAMKPIVLSMYAVVLVMNKEISKAKHKIDDMANSPTLYSYRTHYNLACYYSCLGDYYSLNWFNICHFIVNFSQNYHYAEGLRFLKNALDLKPSLAKWARKDPSLTGVRENAKYEFDKLLDRYDPAGKWKLEIS